MPTVELPAVVVVEQQQVPAQWTIPGWCPGGDDGGRRLNDLAEHIYDGAMADYLLDNASDIGREITPHSRSLRDDAADRMTRLTETCVTDPRTMPAG